MKFMEDIMSRENVSKNEAVRVIKYVLTRFDDSVDVADIFNETFMKVMSFKDLITSKRFELFSQPIVDISRENDIHHYELLSRFEANTSPYEKIKFAEDIGMIASFDIASLGKAFDKARTFVENVFAVNLSGKSIEQPSFVRLSRRMLEKNQDLNGRVFLEITESLGLIDLKEINKAIQKFRDLGFIVCLDDFGAGTASFQYLRDLTVDYVKIDGSYVRRMTDSVKDKVLMQGLIDICDKLDIKVIAEYVETMEQEQMLHEMGVKYCQGWLYGKPRLI